MTAVTLHMLDMLSWMSCVVVAQGRSASSPKSARSFGNASVVMSIIAIITFVPLVLHLAVISPIFFHGSIFFHGRV